MFLRITISALFSFREAVINMEPLNILFKSTHVDVRLLQRGEKNVSLFS